MAAYECNGKTMSGVLTETSRRLRAPHEGVRTSTGRARANVGLNEAERDLAAGQGQLRARVWQRSRHGLCSYKYGDSADRVQLSDTPQPGRPVVSLTDAPRWYSRRRWRKPSLPQDPARVTMAREALPKPFSRWRGKRVGGAVALSRDQRHDATALR
jgi:hypothetical protein